MNTEEARTSGTQSISIGNPTSTTKPWVSGSWLNAP